MIKSSPMLSPLIIALDVDTQKEALQWVRRAGEEVDIFKVGLQLFSREGMPVVKALIARRKRVFVDLKLHDIPNTVHHAVRALAIPGVEFITLHAAGGTEMMATAVAALNEQKKKNPRITTRLLAVTVLTSLDDDDLREIGVDHSVAGQVLTLARLAHLAGVHGVVASPHEVRFIREELPRNLVCVTPGVRLAQTSVQDQKRVMTPGEAMREGSNFLVMGRSLLESPLPKETIQRVLSEIAGFKY